MSNRTRLALANSEEFASALSPAESAVLATVLATLSLATVAGNALVMLSFLLDRRLRTHTNSFLLSLACADMLIGALSMPLFSQYLLRGEWTLGRVICDLWLGQDYMCSTASCLNLLVIGIDRYLSVTRPLRYRARRSGRQVALAIGGVWVTSFLMWPPWIWAWQYIDGRRTVPDDDCYVQFLETNFYLTMVTSVLDYYLPLAIMLLLYYGIWRETRNRKRYLADMDAERHLGFVEDSRSLPKPSRRSPESDRGFLARLFRLNRGSTRISASVVSAKEPMWSAGVNSDPPIVPLCPTADYKAEVPQDESDSSPKDSTASNLDEKVPSRIKNIPLVDVSSSHGSEIRPDDPGLVPLPLKADDETHFTLESYSSLNDDVASDLQNNLCSRGKEVPLVDVSSSRETKHVFKKQSGVLRGDHKAARVLTAILMAFIITTTPYHVIVIIKNLDTTHSLVPDAVWYFFYFLFYVNSTLNPVCYALANRNFKRTYWKILTCSWSRQGSRKASSGQDSRSLPQSRTSTTSL